MATRWETFPIELKGGMVTNLPIIQHGMKAPGSPRILRNFEPSLQGGYRRVNGYTKYNENKVPSFGEVKVQGSGQSGTSLEIANLFTEPEVGDVITIDGVTGTYTIDVVSYSNTDNTATLTLDTSLASSPADKAAVTFTNQNVIQGVWVGELGGSLSVLASCGGTLYEGAVSWNNLGGPNYGTVQVAGGSQTGSSLDVDGITSDSYGPTKGDTFTIDGVEKVYTVTAVGTVNSGAVTLTITPALDSSPADNASVTFLASKLSGENKTRFHKFNFDGTDKVVFVDQTNYPQVFNGTGLETINNTLDVEGAAYVIDFKNHLFFAKGDSIYFTAPFGQNNFDPADGAGTFRLPSTVTGMIVFRERLVIFTERSIHALSGSSLTDFQLNVVANSLGCIQPDTIEEVGGDVMYMGPDGIRYLGATERIGDFNLALPSRPIQKDMDSFRGNWAAYQSVVIRGKSQYRIFGYNIGVQANISTGYLGTQMIDQNAGSIAWAELRGFPVYSAASNYVAGQEYIVFSNDTGYVYLMDQGDDLDGVTIRAKMATPHLSFNDPSFRKTFYTLTTYYTPEGDIDGEINLILDIDNPEKIQPSTLLFSFNENFSTFGTGVFGTTTFGITPRYKNKNCLVGAGFQGSFEFNFNKAGPPFTLDTLIVEFATEERM